MPRWPNAKLCGADKTDGSGTCGHPAGWGTDHPGFGQCRKHGGNTPNAKKAARMTKAKEIVHTLGLPVDISPVQAILEEVHRTAGHVAWLGEQVQSLKTGDLVRGVTRVRHLPDGQRITDMESAVNTWVRLYQDERKHLVQVCKAAADIGLDEYRIRLAQQQGELIARVIQSILDDLDLSKEQRARIPTVVPRHLQAVASSQPETR